MEMLLCLMLCEDEDVVVLVMFFLCDSGVIVFINYKVVWFVVEDGEKVLYV